MTKLPSTFFFLKTKQTHKIFSQKVKEQAQVSHEVKQESDPSISSDRENVRKESTSKKHVNIVISFINQEQDVTREPLVGYADSFTKLSLFIFAR